MAATYSVWLLDPLGTRLALIDNFISLDYTLPVNAIGTLVLRLPPDFPTYYLKPDGRLEVYRNPDSATGHEQLDGETAWFTLTFRRILTEKNERFIEVVAYSAVQILERRIVAYAPGSTQADKTDEADDLMVSVIAQNFGAEATTLGGNAIFPDTQRNISAYFTAATSPSLGMTIAKQMAYRNVLQVFQEIADSTHQNQQATYFDVITPQSGQFQFRTYARLRGADRTGNGIGRVLFSPEAGNVESGTLTYDYRDEVTAVYAGGADTDGADNTAALTPMPIGAPFTDPDRLVRSPLNRRESFVDVATAEGAIDTRRDDAMSALRAGRPRVTLDMKLRDTPQTLRGVHWNLGDLVEWEFDGDAGQATIDSIHVTVAGGMETTEVWLRGYATVTGLMMIETGDLLLLETSDFLELQNI